MGQQFILEGSNEPEFRTLDAFTQGYIEAMFFTDETPGTVQKEEDVCSFARLWTPESDNSLPGDVGFCDLDPATLERIKADCARFQAENAKALEYAYTLEADGLAYTPERAGHDFWLTRNGHGSGFWSREFRNDDGQSDTIGDELSLTCGWRSKSGFGEVWSTLGDDGKVYVG